MSERRYLTAKEAAAMLGITVPTVYAYVSRGLIRSEPGEGKSRARRYHWQDVQTLIARKELRRNPVQAAEKALSWGTPLLESGITLIENGRLYYRGHDVTQLAERHTLADVAQLLWRNELPTGSEFSGDLDTGWRQLQPLWPTLANLTAMERLPVVLPFTAAYDLAAYDLSAGAVADTGRRIMGLMTMVLTGGSLAGSLSRSLQQAWSDGNKALIPLLERALIYCADHELNVSAFTARTVASARATPYAVVIAGLAALQGSRHGWATAQVDTFLREVSAAVNVRAGIAGWRRREERIPGFGHPLYADGDPRGAALLEEISTVYAATPGWQLAREVIAGMEMAGGQRPNIDFALVALAWAAGLPREAPLALFALGRTVGWIGQAIEQYEVDELIRPRARYTGPLPPADE